MRAALALLLAMLAAPAPLAAGGPHPDDLAKAVFGAVRGPGGAMPRAIGSYAHGCLAGARALAADGPTWQAMRLSRNRNWGHPALVDFVRDLARAAPSLGLRGILVGDLSQPRGGPMPYGHASHQIGLDVDIWFREMPEPRLSRTARETHAFVSTLDAEGDDVDPERLTAPFRRLLEHAARDGRVERIFVHPLVKRALCREAEGEARDWLGTIRPWYGHDAHFHVRLSCPEGSPACRAQRPPPPGDGCGAPLDYWFSPAPYRPRTDAEPSRPLTMARMPAACRALVGDVALPVPLPRPRPPMEAAPATADRAPAAPDPAQPSGEDAPAAASARAEMPER